MAGKQLSSLAITAHQSLSKAWPLTPAFGGLLGYILASIAALTISAIKALAQEDIRRERLKTS